MKSSFHSDCYTDEKLIEDIRNIEMRLNVAKINFELESDSDLVEASIYETLSLKARYRYLIRLAKERGIKSESVSGIYIREAV